MSTHVGNVSTSSTTPTTSDLDGTDGITDAEIFTLVVMLVVMVLSLVGNLLVIGAVRIRESLRTPNNIFLVNLALADLGQGIIAIPLRMTEIFNRGTEPLVPCLMVLYVTILFFGVSMITVAMISTDRFIAIRWPFLYVQYFTKGSVLTSIICTWLFMVIFSSVPYLGAAVTPEIPTKFCFYSQYLSQAYLLTMFSLINILIIIILLFTNIYLLKQTLRHIIKIKSQVVPMSWDENSHNRSEETSQTQQAQGTTQPSSLDTPNRTRARYHREIKATKVTIAVVGFTIVLTTPIMVIDLVSVWCPICSPSIITRIAVAMAYANSCVNPWIFAGFNRLYRETYVEVLKRIRKVLLCRS